MKIINADVEFITPIDGAAILKRLEQCGRVCYKSFVIVGFPMKLCGTGWLPTVRKVPAIAITPRKGLVQKSP